MRFYQRKAGGMFGHRTIGWFCFVSVAAIFGCGPIPEDTANNPTTESDGGRVYSNDEWGFRITVPDVWGWTAQTSFQTREPNGLPRVEVVMNREAIAGFEAVLTLRPRALSENSTLQTVTAELEEEFKATFLGYTASGETHVSDIGARRHRVGLPDGVSSSAGGPVLRYSGVGRAEGLSDDGQRDVCRLSRR